MNPNIIYLVDENEEQRRAFTLTLSELFDGTGLVIMPIAPFPAVENYATLVADPNIASIILDQKMEDGGVAYSGIQLSSHLRAIAPKLPIYILTNYTEDRALSDEGEGDVEYVISKKIITDPTTRDAQIFKARVLRRLNTFSDLIKDRAQRYHDLLVKSLNDKLAPEEERELGLLELDRIIPQQAKDIGDVKMLESAIAELRKQIKADNKPA